MGIFFGVEKTVFFFLYVALKNGILFLTFRYNFYGLENPRGFNILWGSMKMSICNAGGGVPTIT